MEPKELLTIKPGRMSKLPNAMTFGDHEFHSLL